MQAKSIAHLVEQLAHADFWRGIDAMNFRHDLAALFRVEHIRHRSYFASNSIRKLGSVSFSLMIVLYLSTISASLEFLAVLSNRLCSLTFVDRNCWMSHTSMRPLNPASSAKLKASCARPNTVMMIGRQPASMLALHFWISNSPGAVVQ